MEKLSSSRSPYRLRSRRKPCRVCPPPVSRALNLNFYSIEIVKFREMIEQRIERQDPPLTSIPDEHKPLIVKLAQER